MARNLRAPDDQGMDVKVWVPVSLVLLCLAQWAQALDAPDVPCTACHADVAQGFADTPHGRALANAGSADAACAGCHGEGAAHPGAPTSPEHIRAFREEPAAEINAACAACHQDAHQSSSAHTQAGLFCVSCHAVHNTPDQAQLPAAFRNVDQASASCYRCHPETFTQFAFNEGHRLAQGAVSCLSCHDAHDVGQGVRLGGHSQAACRKCHADKDGPFVHEHGAGRVEGCAACHAPHGSPNRHMLTHQDNGALCYSCHAGVPQFHVGFSPTGPPRFGVDTVCTNCHVTIHGSNLDRNFLR